jgi:segregation and condensation protein B
MSDNGNKLSIIEALIMSSPEPLPARKIIDLIEDVSSAEIDDAVINLNDKYNNTGASFRIRKIAGGYQTYIIEDYAGYVEELHTRRKNTRLTRSALETLAIIAYRQPATKLDIEMIRGVASDSVLHTLMEKKLITLAGRAQTLGRPLLYRTTEEFLKYFSLNSIDDLPKMEEIEELVSMHDADNQQALPFETTLTGSNTKTTLFDENEELNIPKEHLDEITDTTDFPEITPEEREMVDALNESKPFANQQNHDNPDM